MFILLFILLIIFLFIGYPLLKAYLTVRAARRNFENMFNAGRDRDSNYQNPGYNQNPGYARRRGKVITRDIGEYVEFEDIPGSKTVKTEITYTEENQVEDAEWEDIPKK